MAGAEPGPVQEAAKALPLVQQHRQRGERRNLVPGQTVPVADWRGGGHVCGMAQGARALAEGLKACRALHSLSLLGNCIG